MIPQRTSWHALGFSYNTPREIQGNHSFRSHLGYVDGVGMKSRIQLLLGIALAAALLVVGMLVWVDRMHPVFVTISSMPDQSMRVSITGAVVSPGVVEVPVGARLQDVVDQAGGFADEADLAALNLAGRVGDGEQVVIPGIGEPTIASTGAPAAPASDLIDLNTATVAELDELPGIGEVIGGRIVDYRETNGPFTSVDQLALIEGISLRLVEEIRPYVTVSPPN